MNQPELNPGDLIAYYLAGWRTGHYESSNGYTVTIRPISAKGGAKPRLVTVPLEDTKPL